MLLASCLALSSPSVASASDLLPPDDLRRAFERPAVAPIEDDRTAARVLLGRTLFFDPRLSGDASRSCASCHDPERSWSDGLPRAVGAGGRPLERRTPTLLDVAWGASFFWDGRADTLEAQALAPVVSPEEMDLPLPELEARVAAIAGYAPLFASAFPGEPPSGDTIARALAAFERTLASGTSRFDRWIAGDALALDAAERRGFALFVGEAGCGTCHAGWRFTDEGFYDLGLAGDDPGRAGVVPGVPELEHAFKTPTLREVARRGPYLHDGSAATLEDVVLFYDRGGDVSRPSKAASVRPLGLTAEERADLVAFLVALDAEPRPVVLPALPH